MRDKIVEKYINQYQCEFKMGIKDYLKILFLSPVMLIWFIGAFLRECKACYYRKRDKF